MSKAVVPAEREQAVNPRGQAHGQGKRRHPRTWGSRAPELGDVLTAAGHPLDPALRREMESRLGHDFTQVRIHTDRDATALTELLGADAVTVGQDVFFADGAFQPWSASGRRLIAHELLHTVQAPQAPGALRAGRDAGAVSLPHELIEQQAEDEARQPNGLGDPGRTGDPASAAGRAPEVRAQAPAPAWLRYASATAEQRRAEQLDPATVVDRLAAGILRSLRGDPADSSKRVSLHLARLGSELRSAVLDKLEVRLPSAPYQQVREALHEQEAGGAPLPVDAQPGPPPVADLAAAEEQAQETGDRESRHADAGDSDAERAQPLEQAPTAEQEQAAEPERAAEPPEGEAEGRQADSSGRREPGAEADRPGAKQEDAQGRADEQDRKRPAQDGQEEGGEKERPQDGLAPQAQGAGPSGTAAGTSAAGAPAAPPAAMVPPVAGAAPVASVADVSAGGAVPVMDDRVDAIAEEGPLARHRLTAKPGRTGEHQPDEMPPGEQPEGLDADAASQAPEVGESAPPAPELPAPGPVSPDQYLPKQDMDVSGVPSAGEISMPASGPPPAPAAAPSFPAPPEPELQAPKPGEPDPVEERLQQQDRRDGAEAEQAPGQIGPDAAEQEPATAAEPPGQGAAGTVTAGSGDEGTAEQAAAGQTEAQTGAGQAAGGPAGGEVPADGAGGEVGAEQDEAAGAGGVAATPGALAPDASLEAGGGSCPGGPEPATDTGPDGAAGGAPGGGGGGGAAAETAEQPAVPDVAQQEPAAALATAGQLPATTMLTTLGGVDASVNRSVGQDRAELAASPPQLERPAGAPQTLHGPPRAEEPAAYRPGKVRHATPRSAGEQPKPEAKAVVGAPTPISQVQPPRVTGDQNGKITEADVQNIQEAVDSVPTTDPALDHASVGVTPVVELSGETDPALTDRQLANLQEKSADVLASGREDAAKPLGENHIYPDVPHEMLKAKLPAAPESGQAGAGEGRAPAGGAPTASAAAAGAGGPGGAPGGPDAVGDQAISAVAQQERGAQIQAAVADGQARMAADQQEKQQNEEKENQAHQEQVAAAIKEHSDQQAAERATAKRAVRDQRAQWQAGQDDAIAQADTDSRREHDGKRGEIAQTKTGTDDKIGKQQQKDDESIAAKRREAEKKAREERDKKKEPSGWLSKIGHAIASAFNALVSLVKGIFDAARKFVQDVINKFKNFVTGLIDAARRAIVGLINKLADALIAIGDTLLAAFPGLRDKFRKRIEKLRDDAIRTVNKIADGLKAAVTKLLDALGKALTALLDVLEKGLLTAVQFVRSAVEGVINFVKTAIAILGEFAAIIKDVASDPGGWLTKLGNAIVDGIKYFLWDAVKTAVKRWFNAKVEAIVGLGKMVINVLLKGCFSMAKIARMAWDALISALPKILIQVVIERLVSLLVPAAAAIMAIVQGVIAAYHTISKIIAAIGKFVTFLKAVKSGQGARPFAEAVAAGVVALLEFVTSFLMSKLASAAKGVGEKLKGIADRIMKFLARGAKAVKKGIGTAVNLAKRGAKAAAGAIKKGFQMAVRAGKRGAKWLGRQAKRAAAAIGRGARALGQRLAKTRLGQALIAAGAKLKAKYQQFKAKLAAWRDKFKKWRENRKKNKPTPEQRLARAADRIRPKVNTLLKFGIWRVALDATLAAFKTWYRLSGLSIVGEKVFGIEGRLNPQVEITKGVSIDRDKLLKFIRQLGAELRKGTDAERAAGFSTFSAHTDLATGNTTTTRTARGGGAGILAENIDTAGGSLAKRRQVGDADIIQFVGQGGTPSIDVKSDLAMGGDPRNFTVNVPNPHTGIMTDRPSYKKLKEWVHDMPPKRRQDMAAHMISFLGDTTQMSGSGDDDKFIKSAAVWTILAEGKRNPAAMVTHAMALDMVAQGRMSWKTAFKMMPMAKPVIWKTDATTGRKTRTPGPVNEADMLHTRLFGKRGLRSKRTMRLADQIANREVNIIQAWVSRMNLKFDNTSTKEAREKQLMEAIKNRMMEIYRRAGEAQERADNPGGSNG
jgi:phage-related protein